MPEYHFLQQKTMITLFQTKNKLGWGGIIKCAREYTFKVN